MPTAVDHSQDEPRFVLITQCIQNDFFLNGDCRLRLPDTIVPQMLLGNERLRPSCRRERAGRHSAPPRSRTGRSGSSCGRPSAAGSRTTSLPILHVINVRDWHVPGHAYDVERRAYGSHCEAGTWGVRYVDGLERFLDPTGCAEDVRLRGGRRGARSTTCAPTPSSTSSRGPSTRGGRRKFRASEIEDVLDVVVQGSDEDLETVETAPARGRLRRDPRACPQDRLRATSRGRRARSTSPSSASTRTSRCRPCSSACGRSTTCRTWRSPTRSRRPRRSSAISPGSTTPRRFSTSRSSTGSTTSSASSGCPPAVEDEEDIVARIELRALPLVLPGQAERARLPGREAASVPGAHRAEVAGRLRADQAHEHVPDPLRLHVPGG